MRRTGWWRRVSHPTYRRKETPRKRSGSPGVLHGRTLRAGSITRGRGFRAAHAPTSSSRMRPGPRVAPITPPSLAVIILRRKGAAGSSRRHPARFEGEHRGDKDLRVPLLPSRLRSPPQPRHGPRTPCRPTWPGSMPRARPWTTSSPPPGRRNDALLRASAACRRSHAARAGKPFDPPRPATGEGIFGPPWRRSIPWRRRDPPPRSPLPWQRSGEAERVGLAAG